MKTSFRRFKEFGFTVFLILVGLYTVVLGYMMFYPHNPINIDSVKIFKEKVDQGDDQCFQFVGEKLLPIPVTATIELVNGESIHIMTYNSNNPIGASFKKRCFTIPFHVPDGVWHLRWTGTYTVNPVKRVTKVVNSRDFEIIKTPLFIKGEKGDKGEKGEKGNKGERGLQGVKGLKGN